MVSFRDDPDDWGPDFYILRDGGYQSLPTRAEVNDAAGSLRQRGYVVHEFDCAGWDRETMHDELAEALDFPEWYARDLDALEDCLSTCEVPDVGGMALVLWNFATLAARYPIEAAELPDIVESASHMHLLFGRRFLAILHEQADDGAEDLGTWGGDSGLVH